MEASTVGDVLHDITGLNNEISFLDFNLRSFPDAGGNISQALSVHFGCYHLEAIIAQGIQDVASIDVSPSPASAADFQAILNGVKMVQPEFVDLLGLFVAKKPAFAIHPQPIKIVKMLAGDLVNLNGSMSALNDKLIASAPANLTAQATAVKAAFDVSFASVITAYSE